MSPENWKPASQSSSRSSVRPCSRRAASSASPKRKCGSASSSRPVPARTPYRRPCGRRRANTSNTQSRWAVPSASAAATIVSSYRSVKSAGAGGGVSPVSTAMIGEPRPGRGPGQIGVLRWRRGRTSRSDVDAGDHRRGAERPRPSVGDDRVERPGQPHDVRDLRAPGAVRLRRAHRHDADASGPPRGKGDRQLRPAGADGARHQPAARLRAVGKLPAGLMKPFRSARGGDVVARLEPAEAGIVGLLLDQLEQLLEADADDVGGDPVIARLLPDGHRADPELAADYRELTEASLRSGKADDLATVRATLPEDGGEVHLDADQAGAWLRTSNDLRLALGTRLDISEDTEPPEEITSEEEQQLAVYYWLTGLQGSLVDALVAARDGRR